MRWLVVAITLAACHGNPEKCEKACRNYAELTYWKKADAEIAAAPPEQRDALRKQKLSKFTADLEQGLTLCTTRCSSANNDKQADCLIEAKTADQAKACVDE